MCAKPKPLKYTPQGNGYCFSCNKPFGELENSPSRKQFSIGHYDETGKLQVTAILPKTTTIRCPNCSNLNLFIPFDFNRQIHSS